MSASRDRRHARDVLRFLPAGGRVVLHDPDAFWRGLDHLLRQGRRRHVAYWQRRSAA